MIAAGLLLSVDLIIYFRQISSELVQFLKSDREREIVCPHVKLNNIL